MRFPFSSNIAGIKHYCSPEDEGKYKGYIKAEENNPYDSNALALYTDTGKLIGYIPEDENINFRIWSKGKTDFKCDFWIKYNDPKDYNPSYYQPFEGMVSVIDDTYPIDENNPLFGKNIAYNGTFHVFSRDEIKGFCESFGAKTCNIGKQTDYVVFCDGITDSVRKKMEDAEYHFQVIHYSDIIKLACSANNDSRFCGKTVSFAYYFNPTFKKQLYIYEYLIENGANISLRYKKSTDIVIDRYGSPEKYKAVTEAEKDGKEVIMDNDLIRSFGYNIKDEKIEQQISNKLTTEIKISYPSKKTNNYTGKGCLATFLFFIALLTGFLI